MFEIKTVKNRRKCHICGNEVKQDKKIIEVSTGGMYTKNSCVECILKLAKTLTEGSHEKAN